MSENNQPKKRMFRDVILSGLLAASLIWTYNKVAEIGAIDSTLESISYVAKKPVYKFGFSIDDFDFTNKVIERGEVFGNLLSSEGISASTIHKVAEKSKDIFDVRKFRVGKNINIIRADSCSEALAFVYEPNKLNYVLFDLRDSVEIRLFERDITMCTEIASGTIEGSLWATLEKNNIPLSMIDKMEEALASSVDFYHTQSGDEFKLVFEKTFVEGEEVGTGKLLGSYYKNEMGSFYSVYYNEGKYDGYYDYEGRPAKSHFLKAPIKHARISSRFNLRRFHPIKKRRIPHLGTDYAAPYGTPIVAVADGVVEKASYTSGNGRYVKIKHDKTYKTQYLHMKNFASGMKVGRKVKQGETIGYVGSTGLATGPHVCFRFWENGRQVNYLRHVFEPAEPMAENDLPKFYMHRDIIKYYLDAMEVNPTYADKL